MIGKTSFFFRFRHETVEKNVDNVFQSIKKIRSYRAAKKSHSVRTRGELEKIFVEYSALIKPLVKIVDKNEYRFILYRNRKEKKSD